MTSFNKFKILTILALFAFENNISGVFGESKELTCHDSQGWELGALKKATCTEKGLCLGAWTTGSSKTMGSLFCGDKFGEFDENIAKPFFEALKDTSKSVSAKLSVDGAGLIGYAQGNIDGAMMKEITNKQDVPINLKASLKVDGVELKIKTKLNFNMKNFEKEKPSSGFEDHLAILEWLADPEALKTLNDVDAQISLEGNPMALYSKILELFKEDENVKTKMIDIMFDAELYAGSNYLKAAISGKTSLDKLQNFLDKGPFEVANQFAGTICNGEECAYLGGCSDDQCNTKEAFIKIANSATNVNNVCLLMIFCLLAIFFNQVIFN